MYTSTLIVSLLFTIATCQECPPWAQWQPWTECNCGGNEYLYQAVDSDRSGGLLMPTGLPRGLGSEKRFPTLCGHCAWKIRARKRAMAQGCSCTEIGVAQCDEHQTICSVEAQQPPSFSTATNLPQCAIYDYGPSFLRQCVNHAGASDKDEIVSMLSALLDGVPRSKCISVGDKCKCCCEPYRPSPDGSECVAAPAHQCEPWTEFTEWSDQCMWFTSAPDLMESVGKHCSIDFDQFEHPIIPTLLKQMDDIEVPDRCGYCSFKLKCRQRSLFDTDGQQACFPVDIEKRACGDEQCEGCAKPCPLPKVENSCNYLDKISDVPLSALNFINELPYSMSNGLIKMLTNMPFGKCVEKNGVCNCCCHPYVPSLDGQTCELAEFCPKYDPGMMDDPGVLQNAFRLPTDEL